MGRFVIVLAAMMLAGGLAFAEDRTISWDSGQAEVFDYRQSDGHFIDTPPQADWQRTFTQSISFYAKTFGDVGDRNATLLVLGPQTAQTATIEDAPDSPVIYLRKQFRIADYAGPEGGWVTIPLEPVQLVEGCMAGILTYSTDDCGLMIGLDAPAGELSRSYYVDPVKVSLGENGIEKRDDGRDWLIRLTVRPTLEMLSDATSAELTGAKFSAYDDGVAEEFVTMQKYGPVLRVRNDSNRRVKRVWLYAYVEGDWFNTEREAAVYLMDSRYAILNHGQLPFARYTDQPAWNYVAFDGVSVPKEYLVLIEPFSRPGIELMLGVDSSGPNRSSEFGSVGHAELNWPLDIAQESANWMIRVEYE